MDETKNTDKAVITVEQVLNIADMVKGFISFGKSEENQERVAMAKGVDALTEALQRSYGSKRK